MSLLYKLYRDFKKPGERLIKIDRKYLGDTLQDNFSVQP